MRVSRIEELHAVLKDPNAPTDSKIDALLEASNETHDGAERRRLLRTVMEGFHLASLKEVAPTERADVIVAVLADDPSLLRMVAKKVFDGLVLPKGIM